MTTILDQDSSANFNSALRTMRRGQARLTGDGTAPCPLRLLRANPVNPISGSKILAGVSELDFALPAALPLAWQRLYSSAQRRSGLLGQGWSTPLSEALYVSDGQVVILDAFQRDMTFALPRVGDALYSLSEKITLERTGERSFELIDENGLRKLFAMLPRAYDSAVLVALIDANDNKIGIAWNARQLPESVEDSAGRVFVLDYISHRGQLRLGSISVQREAVDYEEPVNEVVMRYEYDELGNLFRVLNRAGEVTRQFAYMNHIMIEHAQPGGLVSRYEYDEYEWTGKVTRNWTNDGRSWNFRYLNGETLVYDNIGREELFRFDKKRRFTSMLDALGGETVRRLDNHGHVLGVTAPGGHNTTYRYDRRSRLMRSECNGKGTGIVYDARLDKPALITDALGATTARRYDERGNLLSVTDALGNRTAYEYDAHGSPVKATDASGGVRTLAYNRAAQVTSVTDCADNSTGFSYDVDGRLLRVSDARGRASSFSYDAAGRLTALVRPDGAAERYEYDALGRLLAFTDAADKRVSYERDVDGKPLRRIDARGGVLEYRYDAVRRLSELIDEHGGVQRFAYDALDRLIEDAGVDGRQTRYRYDESGWLAAKEELGGAARIETTYVRNSAGQVVDTFISSGTEQSRRRFSYDDLGRVTQAIHADAIVSLEYDALGQLLVERTESGGEIRVVRHAYDQLGNCIQTVLPDGRVLDRLSDGCGHPHQIELDGECGQFHYDPIGRVLSQVAGQIVAAQGAAPPAARKVAYDGNGNLQAIDGKRQGREDLIGRMLSALQPPPDERFAFDPAYTLRPPF
ncbi:RHS repeat protein [Massilia atriviolacea]|uniref:RHS repeat protein n=1 Tax=Massilia atriviolacea TaxID=2495579 RepID=A0A430HT76_9BURK|nr:DUF6531 domain-containing protein [Massilia atriviolacea]RSZ60720.1 RHS repeat protein [Massilia atriviolacea]